MEQTELDRQIEEECARQRFIDGRLEDRRDFGTRDMSRAELELLYPAQREPVTMNWITRDMLRQASQNFCRSLTASPSYRQAQQQANQVSLLCAQSSRPQPGDTMTLSDELSAALRLAPGLRFDLTDGALERRQDARMGQVLADILERRSGQQARSGGDAMNHADTTHWAPPPPSKDVNSVVEQTLRSLPDFLAECEEVCGIEIGQQGTRGNE